MRKLIKLNFILLLILLIVGCTNVDDFSKLKSPIISLDEANSIIYWDEIESAEFYKIYKNDFYIDKTNDYQYFVDLNVTETTTYTVIATGNKLKFMDSDFSNVITIEPKQTTLTKLDAPTIILDEANSRIYWNSISNATSYTIYANNQIIDTISECSYDINLIVPQTVAYKVVANTKEAGYESSNFSNTISIKYDEPDISTISKFLMVNDTHGAFNEDSNPGIDRVGGLIASLEADGDDYIKIANGDIFQGSYVSNILYGLPMVDALNAMEFDAFVLGNHEFDWGLDQIAIYKDGNPSNGELNCPILGANVVYKNTGNIVEFLDPYTVVESKGLKIGIIGLMGYGLESSILQANVADYQFLYPTQIVQEHAITLRTTHDCDIVVVSIHDFDASINTELANLSGDSRIDAIFCGHTHQKLNSNDGVDVRRSDGMMIPVIQNYSQNGTAAEVVISLDDNLNYKNFTSTHYYPRNYAKDAKVTAVINKYQNYIDEGNRVLGACENYLSRQTLGQMITDAMKEKYTADVAIFNTGGIRDTIANGEITVSDVFNVIPFNNIVYTVNMTGSSIKSLYNNNASYLYFNSSFNVYSLSDNRTYKVAVIDYVFTSPYYYEFKNLPYNDTSDLARDLLIDYIEKNY